MTRFCIYCGAESSPENPVIDGVCLRCRIERWEIVSLKKNTLRYELCKICGNIRVGYRWLNTHGFEEAISLLVREEIPRYIEPGPGVSNLEITGFEYITEPNWRTRVRINLSGLYGGQVFDTSLEAVILFTPVKCPRCKMIESGEYEALLQIRGTKKHELNELLKKEFDADPRLAIDLVDVIETDRGVDLYFYNYGAARKLARRLARKLGFEMHESYETVGTRSGRQRARLTIILKP